MKNYYKILGVNKLSTNQEIKDRFLLLKTKNSLNNIIIDAYTILDDYHSRRKYDELLEQYSKYSIFNISFFGYDFDERNKITTSPSASSGSTENNGEIKRYKIDNNRYLLYEKRNENGIIIKKFYIEINGKTDLIPDNKINELKNEYYEIHKKELLKDKYINKVLTK
jgi:DnaJ-class molecular chaperone